MSYLDRPRIGFLGTDAMTNPSTGNNENVIHLLDYDNVELLNPPELVGGDLKEMSDAAYREWMGTLMTVDGNPGNDKEPGWQPAMPGYWNYYGDHLTTFGTGAVNSVWLDAEPAASDPLLGARVAFNAKLVDVDPADTFSSQLICAAFSLVGPGTDGELVELLAGVPTISHLRWTNFSRPFGAGTFQCVIENDALRFADGAPDSPGLDALRSGAAAGGGLVLRYCLYNLQTRKVMAQMYDAFQQGDYTTNPKFGHVLGTIGVWNGTDMTTAPVGRILQQPGPPFSPAAPKPAADGPDVHIQSHADLDRLHTEGTDANAALAAAPDPTTMGPAVAVVGDGVIALDLLTSFAEQSPTNMAKLDFGPVELLVDDGAPEPLSLGPVAYDQATYEAQAGVVELALPTDPDALARVAAGSLVLRDAAGVELLREIDCLQVETDDRGVYLDMTRAGDEPPTAHGSMRVRAFAKGEPAPDPFTLRVEVVHDVMQVGTANSVSPLVVQQNLLSQLPSGVQYEVDVPAGGEADVPIDATAAGCFKLRFLPPGMGVPDPPALNVEFFGNYRVLPFHDYGDVPDDEITWDFVYREVFSYYGILYPIMSLIIPWGPDTLPNDPVRVAQFAAIMRQAVDQRYLGTALSMPITRELDAGKRALVQRWCDLQPRPAPQA